MASKKNKYELSTDYQLPPGELWWIVIFINPARAGLHPDLGRAGMSILFHDEKAQTWFQAKQVAEILVRESNSLDVFWGNEVPKFEVKLWEPEQKVSEHFKQFA